MAPTPFQIAVPDSEVTDLKRRIRDTRWLTSVLGAGWSMGVDLGYLRALADFWSVEESRTSLVRYRSGERREEHMPLRLGQLAAQLEAQIEQIPSRAGID